MQPAPHILVVDDERDVRETIADVLRDEGYSVAEAADGCEALREARANLPAAILLDLNMPRMDGRECRTRLARDHALRDVPVVIVSACLAHDVHAVSATAHLHKPFALHELVSLLAGIAPVRPASDTPCVLEWANDPHARDPATRAGSRVPHRTRPDSGVGQGPT